MPQARSSAVGFGLGLRTQHYSDFLANPQAVDWLEIITDNFLVDGGRPLKVLDSIRLKYPMAMHGVAMSIGSAGGVNKSYLQKVKALAKRIEPLWVSDHLCWTGYGANELHDLYPIPHTQLVVKQIVDQILQAQDILGRRLVIENVSSYIDFAASEMTEWEFLSLIAQQSDCLLLVDVNNIYVSSRNQGFDAQSYIDGLPIGRVQQIHLAGHSDCGDHIIDTHDHPVSEGVWALYKAACLRFGKVSAMIERDADIPPLSELIDELDIARGIAAAIDLPVGIDIPIETSIECLSKPLVVLTEAGSPNDAQAFLDQTQRVLSSYVLSPIDNAATLRNAKLLVRSSTQVESNVRLEIYHNAYRARLAEVLADTFEKTYLFMGSDMFDVLAREFAVVHPPMTRSLNHYGDGFADYLRMRFPENFELFEMAQLDYLLRCCFDHSDEAVLSVEKAQLSDASNWLMLKSPLVETAVLLESRSNVVSLWNAIHADEPVPEVSYLPSPSQIMVWRKDESPHFQSLDESRTQIIRYLIGGSSISQACEQFETSGGQLSASDFGVWLRQWLDDGLFRADTTTINR
jgi:uncharacterized protein (UPF0276 family)